MNYRPKQSKEAILKVRAQAISLKQWHSALNISYVTLRAYCKYYQIPFNLTDNYIEPIPPLTKEEKQNNNNSSSSLLPPANSQWDQSLLGSNDKLPQPGSIYVSTDFKQVNKGSPFKLPGNPGFRSPRQW